MRLQYRDSVLALAVFANFSQVGARLVISPLIPDIVRSFAVSKSAVGFVLTAMWAAFAFVQFPSGVLADQYSERRVILVSLLLTSVCSLLLSVISSFYLFGLFAVLLGAGAGLYFSASSSLLTKLFENTGQALGVHSAGSPLAGLVVPVAAASLAVRYGWRTAFLLGTGFALTAFVLVAWWIEATSRTPSDPLHQQFNLTAMTGLLKRPGVGLTILVAIICMFTFQSFLSFFPTFLVEYHGRSTQRASIVFAMIFVLSAVGQPIVGRVSDTFDRTATLGATLLVAVVGFWTLLQTQKGLVFALGIGLLGFGFAWPGVLNSRIMSHFSDDERGAGFGLMRTTFILPGSLGSVVTGTLADVAGWPTAYGVVMALLIAAIAILTVARLRPEQL